METKTLKRLSIVAFIASVLPMATLIPTILKMTLSDGIRTAWMGANIVFVLLGLLLSMICMKKSESRSMVNILSLSLSILWILMMIGIVVLALFINFFQ